MCDAYESQAVTVLTEAGPVEGFCNDAISAQAVLGAELVCASLLGFSVSENLLQKQSIVCSM